MSDLWVFLLGGLAQVLFAGRTFIQWIRTEKARSVQSPVIFWQLSLLASLLFMVYGILRDDLVIILGQLISYYIYIRNLQLKNVWDQLPVILRSGFIVFPLGAVIWMSTGNAHNWSSIIQNEDISLGLMVLGMLGQAIFAIRFVFQWLSSERHHESVFPPVFWIISITGALLILAYAVFRSDPVLVAGQTTGLIIYIRNLQRAGQSPTPAYHEKA